MISDKGNSSSQEMGQFLQGFGIFSGEKSFQNELQILKSKALISQAVGQLNYQVSYFSKTFFRNIELYGNAPFVVIFDNNIPMPVNTPFTIEIFDSTSFRISLKGSNVGLYSFNSHTYTQILPKLKIKRDGRFGSEQSFEDFKFKIVWNKNFDIGAFPTNKFIFTINDPKSMIDSYKGSLQVDPDDVESTVAVLKLRSTSPQRAIEFINSLTSVYLERDLDRKVHLSIKTIEYIDDQLNIIKDSLRTAEANLQRYRTSNQVMDVTFKSGRIYDQMQDLETQRAELTVKLKYYEYINGYFEQNKELSDLIAPSSMGIEDPLLNNMIQELIRLNSEKTSLVDNNQEKSPYLKKLNIQIENLKNTISENIKYIIKTAQISLNDLNTRVSQLNSEINKLPRTERELFGIERKFNLNDALYTFLMQKRAEAQIAKAAYLPDADIIEPADIVGGVPISPKSKRILAMGFILGLVLPIGVLRLFSLMNNKVRDKDDLERLSDIPIIGQVYNNNKKTELVVTLYSKSHIAESIRRLRSNLSYFLGKRQNSVILITSTFGQEGKSFISLNLAVSIALTNKKTILLGFDLRKPKFYERLDVKMNSGISSLLSDQATLDDVIQPTNIEHLDVITAGEEPPNPSELISSPNTKKLIKDLRGKYEYIIIDTPPVGLISDAHILMETADLNIYVVRQNQSTRSDVLSNTNELLNTGIKNLCFVLNDIVLLKKTKYGYDYYTK
jgi:capsular exopolysaccharide synthesis family protein